MKIAIVGPTHPYKGGIAKHTTMLAHKLSEKGHAVTIYSWKHQYPFFYPGQQFVPNDKPEVEPFANTVRTLSWRSPLSWGKTGRKLRGYDKVIFVWWVPTIQGPIYLSMMRAMGDKVKKVMLCHNVLPHESKPGDKILARQVISAVDSVIVHSKAQSEIACSIVALKPILKDLPPVFPPKPANYKHTDSVQNNLIFFGLVRPYKGLDVLLHALSDEANKGVGLTVVGEIWGENIYQPLVDKLGIAGRVKFINSYVPDESLYKYFALADASVLPYRGGTATFNVACAHYFGIPVIATRAASMENQVKDKVDGLLCDPDDVKSLSNAIEQLYSNKTLVNLRKNVQINTDNDVWSDYILGIIK